MKEFKAVSFVVFDEKGKAHKLSCDKINDERPNFNMKGDAALLLNRWRIMSRRVEMFLKGQDK